MTVLSSPVLSISLFLVFVRTILLNYCFVKQRCVTVNPVVLVGIVFLIPLFFQCHFRLACDYVLGILSFRILER